MDLGHSRRRILLAGDGAFPGGDLEQLIDGQPDLLCCSPALADLPIDQAIAREKPELVLIGIGMPIPEVFDLIHGLQLRFPGLKMLLVSEGDEAIYGERALEAGARGYVMAQESQNEFLKAIRAVLSGKIYLSHRLTMKVVQRILKPDRPYPLP